MKYRDHRGGYSESMATEQEFDSPFKFRAYLTDLYGPIAEIRFSSPVFDPRNGWNTRVVSFRNVSGTKFFVAGMSDGEI